MTPSDEYLDYLNSVDVRAITTTAGRRIVGEYHGSNEHGIFLINGFVFEPFDIEPLYPFSFNVPFLITDERIESEMVAGIALKKEYYDQYTKYRIEMLNTEDQD